MNFFLFEKDPFKEDLATGMTRQAKALLVALSDRADDADIADIISTIQRSAGYSLALQFIQQSRLIPRRRWKTCSIERVRTAMADCTGCTVSLAEMALALGVSGFVA